MTRTTRFCKQNMLFKLDTCGRPGGVTVSNVGINERVVQSQFCFGGYVKSRPGYDTYRLTDLFTNKTNVVLPG